MVPIHLELRNFMSYGDEATVVDFSQTPFLCLSGENGHGKSALLDAITWTLWGVSRAGRKNHDDLIRIGADEMSVRFTFAMDGPLYRVQRKRSRRTGTGQWDLQQLDGADYKSLTGGNSGATERALLSLLRMSYETFLNSAYLRQGQADLFVQQTPTRRKDILAEILDLSRYDSLEAAARQIARDAEMESRDLHQEVSMIDAELLLEPEHQRALGIADQKRNAAQNALDELRKGADRILQMQIEVNEKAGRREAVANMLASIEKELVRLRHEVRDHGVNSARANEVLAHGPAIEARAVLRTALRAELVSVELCVESLSRLRSESGILDRALHMRKSAVEMDLHRLETASRETDREIDRLSRLVEEGAQIRANLRRLPDVIAEAELLGRTLGESKNRLHDLSSDIGRIKAGIQDWEARIAELASQQGSCRVCNAPLSRQHIAEVSADYVRSLEALRNEQRTVAAEGRGVRDRIKSAEISQNQLIQEQAALGAQQTRLMQIERDSNGLDSLRAMKVRQIRDLHAVRSSLQDGSYAQDEQLRIDALAREIALLEPAEIRRAEIFTQLKDFEGLDKTLSDLAVARQSFEREESLRQRVENSVREKEVDSVRLGAQLAALEDVSAEAARLKSELADANRREREETVRLHAAVSDIGRFTEAIDVCTRKKSVRTVKQDALTETRRRFEVHSQLALAFGKKGVQALIIENAIPELQDEANRLLARLSDGDLSVSLETQRASKSKKDSSIETLDIKVSDSLGTRPLEMYSGGEGFRVAFALRLALSKLLTRRAGARLETLIIDEGFGTQDGKGREKLVDVLAAVRDEFEKIIVITHIDELKDSFPARLEVIKTPSGSQVTLLEGVGV